LPTYFASLPPQAEDIPARARKKRRLEDTPLSTTRARTTDESARKTPSPDLSVVLPPPAAHGDIDDASTDADPVSDTQPNAVATTATASYTLQEEAKLTSAVANTSKKMWGKEYKTDWVAVAALVPGRTRKQCWDRWDNVLDPSIDRANESTDKWSEDEDSKLKDAVRTHGGKNWGKISALVPGRTKSQCNKRWRNALDPSIDRANKRTGSWTAVEDSKLKDAVQTHGGKNRGAISELVAGRSRGQCQKRWHDGLDPSINQESGLWSNWTAVEDSKLKDAVRMHGGKNWKEIATVVPGRKRSQCLNRWHNALDPSIDRTNERMGKWVEDEDIKLKDAVLTHGGKNWGKIAALVPGRTRKQCNTRWKDVLDPRINRPNDVTCG
jgi:hypothetical protein